MNKLLIPLKELDKEEQTNPQTSIRKEIIKIRVEINAIKTKKNNRSMKPGAGSLKRSTEFINLARLIKERGREKTQIKITNEGEITTNTSEIQIEENIMKNYMPTKLDNLEEMDKFLETYNLPKLKQEEI